MHVSLNEHHIADLMMMKKKEKLIDLFPETANKLGLNGADHLARQQFSVQF